MILVLPQLMKKNNSYDYIAKIAAQNIQDKYSEHMTTAALSYVASNLRDEFEKMSVKTLLKNTAPCLQQ